MSLLARALPAFSFSALFIQLFFILWISFQSNDKWIHMHSILFAVEHKRILRFHLKSSPHFNLPGFEFNVWKEQRKINWIFIQEPETLNGYQISVVITLNSTSCRKLGREMELYEWWWMLNRLQFVSLFYKSFVEQETAMNKLSSFSSPLRFFPL